MALWNFRGVMETEWQDRKEAIGLTIEQVVRLGIETAEHQDRHNTEAAEVQAEQAGA